MIPTNRLMSQLQRRTADGFYSDAAFLVSETETSKDAYGQPVTTETSTPIECSYTSYTDKASTEKWTDYADIEQVDAEIRFTSEVVTPKKGDKIRLAGRFSNLADDPQTYDIIGIKERDVFGYVAALRRVAI